jgi:hypothetical protein
MQQPGDRLECADMAVNRSRGAGLFEFLYEDLNAIWRDRFRKTVPADAG